MKTIHLRRVPCLWSCSRSRQRKRLLLLCWPLSRSRRGRSRSSRSSGRGNGRSSRNSRVQESSPSGYGGAARGKDWALFLRKMLLPGAALGPAPAPSSSLTPGHAPSPSPTPAPSSSLTPAHAPSPSSSSAPAPSSSLPPALKRCLEYIPLVNFPFRELF